MLRSMESEEEMLYKLISEEKFSQFKQMGSWYAKLSIDSITGSVMDNWRTKTKMKIQ
jgi:hypothetical protein